MKKHLRTDVEPNPIQLNHTNNFHTRFLAHLFNFIAWARGHSLSPNGLHHQTSEFEFTIGAQPNRHTDVAKMPVGSR